MEDTWSAAEHWPELLSVLEASMYSLLVFSKRFVLPIQSPQSSCFTIKVQEPLTELWNTLPTAQKTENQEPPCFQL